MNALEIPFPDSSVAQAANQLVLEVSPPFLYFIVSVLTLSQMH
jgi:hypothetical protein